MKIKLAAWLTAMLLATALPLLRADLPGLTIVGESFTYNAPDGVVRGRIKFPSGRGPFPAVLLSHGKGGNAPGIMTAHGSLLVEAGLVCIAPDYTHAGNNVNTRDNEGYCPENSRRARACLDILRSLGLVDMSRIGAFGHSMGSFLTIGLCGESGIGIRAAVISAGGIYSGTVNNFVSPSLTEAQGIVAPMLIFHGTVDTVVPPEQSARLDALLTTTGVPHHRVLYTGVDHSIAKTKKGDIHALMRAWFTTYGVLAPANNQAPGLSAPATITIPAGSNRSPVNITLSDDLTAPANPTRSVFSTNKARIPASFLTRGGRGANRSRPIAATAGSSENVELAVVVNGDPLRTAAFANVAIAGTSGTVNVNHRPILSRLASQRTTPSSTISGLAFTVSDPETIADALVVTAESSNPSLLPVSNITFAGSGGSRTISLAPVPGQSGRATVTITVSDGEKSTATAFAVTVEPSGAGNTAPVIQAIDDAVLPAGSAYTSRPLVIKDDESAEAALVLSGTSSNPTLIPSSAIVFGGQNWGRTVSITPVSGQTGRATITFTVSDGTNSASTASVIEVVAGNTTPIVSELPTYATQTISDLETNVSFSVSDLESSPANLRVAATSSNPALLPASGLLLSGSGTNRTLTLQPIPAASGACRVTVTASDGTSTASKEFLFVVTDPQSAESQYEHAQGIFALDSADGTRYTTTFGKTISLRDGGISTKSFVDGYALRLAWNDLESSTTPGAYDFTPLANILSKLPSGQRLSMLLMPGEPSYIANTPGVETWSDAGTLRPRPWSPYLRERRRAFIQALAAFVAAQTPLSTEPRLYVINPDTPGAFNGIRDPNKTPLRNIPGYTRATFLEVIRDELRAWQTAFPGKLVQIGCWPVLDNENAAYGGLTAWSWFQQQLLAEFNGTTRPRIGFFMDNLAARRAALPNGPYTATPKTPFADPLIVPRSQVWIGIQMLGSWSRPFNDAHVNNTLNGSPADALEYAYNTFGMKYSEIYISDFDPDEYQTGLQSWHDFLNATATPSAPLRQPSSECERWIQGRRFPSRNSSVGLRPRD